MKHSLQLKLSQHLTLTPQLQQSIRLLQLSTLELNQELETFLQQNPFLERSDSAETGESSGPPSESAHEGGGENTTEVGAETSGASGEGNETPRENETSQDWDMEGSGWTGRDEDDDTDYPQLKAEAISLSSHLSSQLGVTPLSKRDKQIVSLMIDALNEDGYLTQDLDELAEILPPELEIEPIELQTALKHLQNLDPPGIGARNLAECLAIQLDLLPAGTPYRDQALQTVKQHLNLLAARDYGKLKKLLRCDDDDLRAIQHLIVGLNPRPGAAFSTVETRYIQPDVVIKKIKDKWVANLNPDVMPRLRINQMYADILRRHRDQNSSHLSSQMQEAKWMIKNVQQRFDTILRVSQAIVDRQKQFFEHGEVAMRPLVLREIAETVGLHESTISRVTTQKFMLTPLGVFELKHFFGSHVATETGGACSATAIRALIKQLISAENTRKPLSDSQIAEILGQQGIVVARRTVAKYRESLQIPAVSLRKSI